MELLSKEEFTQLAEAQETPSISIYMPLEQEPDKQDKNRIRLKNHLKHAENTLHEQYQLSPQEIAHLLQPAARLIQDGRFTGDRAEGMALFLSPEQSYLYSLPVTFAEEQIISSHFYLKPLLPLMTENGRFYILALSQNEIRLLQATRYAVQEVTLPETVPQTLAQALKWEDPESHLQWHTGTSASTAQSRSAIFHGHGVSTEESQKENIEEFFRQVAAGIDKLLKGQAVPMVLAGVDYLLPLYRESSHYPHLLETGLQGNPKQLSPCVLRDQGWELVAPLLAQKQEEVIGRIAAHSDTDRVTQDLEKIITAAHFGQVELLLLDEEAKVWGTFDPAQGAVEQHEAGAEEDSQELLDRTAVWTYLYGGTLFLLPSEQMPGQAAASVLLRTPVQAVASMGELGGGITAYE